MNVLSKINSLLTPIERKNVWVIFTLMILGTLLEMLGIGLIIPVMAGMMQTDLIVKYPVVVSLLSFIDKPSQTEIITAVMLALVAVFLVKNLFLAFLLLKQTRFSFGVLERFSRDLFEIYLHQPYSFHLQRNSAQLVINVTGEVGSFAGVLAAMLLLCTELMVLIGITILLILVDPLGTLIVATVFGATAWVFHYQTRDRISRWGHERQLHDGLRIQHVQQGLGGAKDVKLLGRESDFLGQYQTHNVKSARAWNLLYIFQGLPRLIFEILAVIALAILVLSLLSKGREMTSIIPALGLFAAAAFRLMPSITRVLNSVQTIRYYLSVVNTLYDEVNKHFITRPSKMAGSPSIFKDTLRLTNVTYHYPKTVLPAVEAVSITVPKGSSIGLIGKSGSGKSTLVDIILGLLIPTAGMVEVDRCDIQKDLRQWQDQIGYVPQSIFLTDDTLRRNVAFGLPENEIDDLAIQRAIKAAQLDEFVSTLGEGLDTVVGERGIRLSGGQRQRIGIARALYHDPSILVLDEATSALDTVTERGVMEAVMALQGSKTIIIVAHRFSTVEHCDRLYSLERGKVVAEGEPQKILSSYRDDVQSSRSNESNDKYEK
jgi:ABC-type multidrug transport system fused ATPase/permease subunit